MTTNNQGNGNTGTIIIPKEDLVADCGRPAGERTGHVDVGGFSTTNAELTSPFSWCSRHLTLGPPSGATHSV